MSLVVIHGLESVHIGKDNTKALGRRKLPHHNPRHQIVHGIPVLDPRQHVHRTQNFKLVHQLVVRNFSSKEECRKFHRFLDARGFFCIKICDPNKAEHFVVALEREQHQASNISHFQRLIPFGVTLLDDFHVLFILDDQAIASRNRFHPQFHTINKVLIEESRRRTGVGIGALTFAKQRKRPCLKVCQHDTTVAGITKYTDILHYFVHRLAEVFCPAQLDTHLENICRNLCRMVGHQVRIRLA